MGSNFTVYRLGDIASFAYGKMPKKHLLGSGKYITYSGYRYIESYPEKNTSAGDIIVVARGVGGTGDVKLVLQDCYLTNLSIKISLNKQHLLNEYFYYLFKQKNLRHLDSGSAQSQITIADLSNIVLHVPSTDYQLRVINHLKKIDDKITLNRQINQTLEQMAQVLFKSWFVDFDPVVDNALDAGFFEQDLDLPDELLRRAEARQAVRKQSDFKTLPDATRQLFPAAFEESTEPSLGLGGWVPKGWQVQNIKDFANVTDYVANGSFAALKENVTLFDEPEYALYIRTTDFKNDFDKGKAKYIDKHAYNFLSKTKLSGSEVIISNVGDVGTVFRPPSWLGMPMTLGSNAIAVSTQHLNDYLFFYFSSQAGQSAIDGIVSGSAQQKFNKTGFRSLKLLLPSNNVVIKFNEVYKDISLKNISNKRNISLLEQLRDTLLPKLISGELRLDNIEAELATK